MNYRIFKEYKVIVIAEFAVKSMSWQKALKADSNS